MSEKIKKHILFPLVLIIYVAVMAVISYPKYEKSGNWKEFLIILGLCILIAILLYFVLKRQQRVRDKYTRDK